MTVRGYKELLVWQKALLVTRNVYRLTRSFPSEERFGLIAQMRRAAVSIPSNIAEGQARRTTREFIQFLSHSEGSLAELETQMLISVDLAYCHKAEASPIFVDLDELRKMLNALRRKLERKGS